ncbi:MAG: hypothetical protein CFK52_11175 [Chloracidobacterium sp. CP2_5A]|nr:MAG: hypothetical protein CFK52_11175 [Chloracidobacterium sp. CP2_5A]
MATLSSLLSRPLLMTPTTNDTSNFAAEQAPIALTVTRLCGALAGQRQVVRQLPVVIGRSRQCAIRLSAADAEVSGRHAQISFDGHALWVEDLGSANGTRLNDQPIGRAALASGDEIELGPGGPRLRVTFDWPAAQWVGNVQGETYHLGTCEFPLRSALRFPIYGAGALCLLLPLWLGSLVAAVLFTPLGLLALLLGWSLTRVNITITPLCLEYQGVWRQVTLPWSEVTRLQVDLRGAGGRRATYAIFGSAGQSLTFQAADYVSGVELAQLIVRRTGKRWEPPLGES